MNPALVISRREIRTYFNSPVAYIVVSVFTIIAGVIFFFTQLFVDQQADMRGFFGSMPLLFMFLAPAITMRLLAEEKASGHAGAADHHAGPRLGGRGRQVPGGDGAAGARRWLLTLVFAITVRALGPLDRGPTIGGYLGLLLMGGAYVAIGVMASAFTRNSIMAFIVAFAISFVLFMVGQVTQFVPQRAAAAGRVPGHRQPLREHQPRRHRHPRRHLLPLGDGRQPAGGDAVPRIAAVEVSHGIRTGNREGRHRPPHRAVTRPRRRWGARSV